jgi:hypothetical protein
MYAFLCDFKPYSVNPRKASKKAAYYARIVNAFRHYHSTATLLNQSLYGFVYYFHRHKTQLDADNVSKPVWDALKNAAYQDDKIICFRSSGLFNLQSEGIEVLDLSAMPDYVLEDFLIMIENEDHLLYVEFGKFDYDLFKFGYQK